MSRWWILILVAMVACSSVTKQQIQDIDTRVKALEMRLTVDYLYGKTGKPIYAISETDTVRVGYEWYPDWEAYYRWVNDLNFQRTEVIKRTIRSMP